MPFRVHWLKLALFQVNKQYEELLLDLLHASCFRESGLGMTILGLLTFTSSTAECLILQGGNRSCRKH
jgi:hypothetical protein